MKSPWIYAPPDKGKSGGSTEISIHAQPRSSRSEIVGIHGDRLKVRLAAPPVEGHANRELQKLLAKTLGVPRGSVEVIRGATGRKKTVRILGMEPEEVRQRLGLP